MLDNEFSIACRWQSYEMIIAVSEDTTRMSNNFSYLKSAQVIRKLFLN
jgi:hypothetical protein